MSDLSVQIRVTSVRSRGKTGGGALFSGQTDSGESYVADCDYRLISDPSVVDIGQLWKIAGPVKVRSGPVKGGTFLRHDQVIKATHAELLRPAGQNLIRWIEDCQDCPGVGPVRAAQLYDRFGPELVKHLEERDITALAEIITEEQAGLLCEAFSKHDLASTLLWLDQIGVPPRLGKKIVTHYGNEVRERIEANPYVLLSFTAGWKEADTAAREKFGVAEDDPRRLEAGIEEVLYRAMDQGHTCLPTDELKARLRSLLGSNGLIAKALALTDETPMYRRIGAFYQPEGTYVIESFIAARLHQLVEGTDDDGQVGLFRQKEWDVDTVNAILDTYHLPGGGTLTEDQREAVVTCVRSNLSLILGGAGTGKTTVLNALYYVLEKLIPDVQIHQIALAGRAALRMTEATDRDGKTIAGFLSNVHAATIPMGSLVVVDEMSMVDALLFYRLIRHLPGNVWLIMVGDPSQLSPIGPGLVLHALAGLGSIPQTTLTTVKRQSLESGIPQVAAAIRAHKVPVWAEYHGGAVPKKLKQKTQRELFDRGVSFIPCSDNEIGPTTLRVYEELGGCGQDFSVQILSVTNGGIGGVGYFNLELPRRYQRNAEVVYSRHPSFGVVGSTTTQGLAMRVGDLVIFTKNDYEELDLRNGSLGKIIRAIPFSQVTDPCCECDFNGRSILFNSDQIALLEHAYSITIHKAQGSQFRQVIIPIRKSRLLDQSLIYTAVTRGVEQVVLVGDMEEAIAAIQAPAAATRRYVMLPKLLEVSE